MNVVIEFLVIVCMVAALGVALLVLIEVMASTFGGGKE